MNEFQFLTATSSPDLFFEPEHFLDNLSFMGIGMALIFMVIGLIVLSTMITNHLFSEE